MSRYLTRPRAPSPPRSSDDDDFDNSSSDNTYSIVEDPPRRTALPPPSAPPPPPPPKNVSSVGSTKRRFFGGGGNSVDVSSGSSASSTASTTSGSYGRRGTPRYDAATVEEIKTRFQQQIEAMLLSQERHDDPLKDEEEEIAVDERGQSFAAAKDAVQRHIEKMIQGGSSAAGPSAAAADKQHVKHIAHGVSHVLPEEEEHQVPPPVHYGIQEAIGKGSHSAMVAADRKLSAEGGAETEGRGLGGLKRLNALPPINDPVDVERRMHQFHEEGSKVYGPDKSQDFLKHKVDYLGSLPIATRSTNLAALQGPLKDLYFKYRAMKNLGQTNLPGTLEINDTGLKIQYIRELHKGVQEIFNPFPTIAVWAAVKFVHRREATKSGYIHHQFAFLPLISDPETQDKTRLFQPLDFHEVELAADAPHPPVFACVMRRNGVPRQLECHGFVCANAEEAIMIAANLYQALLETMKRQRGKPAAKTEDVQTAASDSDQPPPLPPLRPPRKKKQTAVARTSSVHRRSLRGKVTHDPTRKGRLARADSARKSGRTAELRRSTRQRASQRRAGGKVADPQPAGDVYTKVAIPRSKSFMTVGGQYNLQELFRELKEKEGVESIDDVLKKVITPNGISFNEIKPVYRELLLKLAMTMSQDEIFARSKNIISQEKKKTKKEKRKKREKGTTTMPGSTTSTLGSFFKMTFSNTKTNAANLSATETLVSNKSSISKADISGPIPIAEDTSESIYNDESVYCSQCGYESVCNLSTHNSSKTLECDAYSCLSEEKCYCSIRQSNPVKQRPKLPTLDGEPKIVPSPKLIAPPSNQPNKMVIHVNGSAGGTMSSTTSVSTYCTCQDCTESSVSTADTTCYSSHDQGPPTRVTTRPQIHQQPSLSRCESPQTAWTRNMKKGGSYWKSHESLLSSNQRYTHPHHSSRSSGGGTISGSSIYSGSTSAGSRRSAPSAGKMVRIAATDTLGKMIRRGGTSSTSNLLLASHSISRPSAFQPASGRSHSQQHLLRNTSEETSMLSLKKSAEIAATFSGAKINQTTENFLDQDSFARRYHQRGYHSYNRYGRNDSSAELRTKFKTGLGYFP